MSSESSVITKVERTNKGNDQQSIVNRPIGMTNPDTPPERVVLVACGSYNPPTNMHLRMFELARDALHRDKRYQVIAGIMSPVNDDYGKHDLVPSRHRCAMLRLALHDSDWISLDTWECDEVTWTETVKVLRYYRDNPMRHHLSDEHEPDVKRKRLHLKDENTTPIRIMLLCGADFLQSFQRPGLWEDNDIEEIVRDFGIVCISRTGSDTNIIAHESDLLSKHRSNIHLVTEWLSNEISSTGVRRSLRRSESIKYLLPNDVISYIELHKLYLPDNISSQDSNGPSSSSSSEEELILLDKLNNGHRLDVENINSLLQQVDLLRDQFVSRQINSDLRAIDNFRNTHKDNNIRSSEYVRVVDPQIDHTIYPSRINTRSLRSTSIDQATIVQPAKCNPMTGNSMGLSRTYLGQASCKGSFEVEELTSKSSFIKDQLSGPRDCTVSHRFPTPCPSANLPSTSVSLPCAPSSLSPLINGPCSIPVTSHNPRSAGSISQHNRRQLSPGQRSRVIHDQMGVSREQVDVSREKNSLNDQFGQKLSNLRISSFTPETCV